MVSKIYNCIIHIINKFINYIFNNILARSKGYFPQSWQISKKILPSLTILLIIMFIVVHSLKFLFNQKFKPSNIMVVKTDPVLQKNIPVNITAIGIVKSSTSVDVKAQTTGKLLQSYFNDGQLVQQGELLFEIDQASRLAYYNQANANLEKSKANLKKTELELERYSKLYKDRFISSEKYQQILANYKIAKAQFAESTANVTSAQIELDYTKIYAPITGVAGEIFLKPGNLIKSGTELLVNINQTNPINVEFNISAKYLPELIKYIDDLNKFNVTITNNDVSPVNNSNCMVHYGKLIFVDNKIDHFTGNINLKAQFANDKLSFWPGQFVNISLTIKILVDALVVPNRAIQVGQKGLYVYVIKKINKNKKKLATVKKTFVKVGEIIKEETVILEGVQSGEAVVTEGHGHLLDNSIVKVYEHK